MMLTTQRDESTAKTRSIGYGLILAALTVMMAGCSAPVSGRLQNSPEVTQVFRSNQILAGHQYYVSGFQRIPYAIIAVDNSYQLQTGHWQPIDMDSTDGTRIQLKSQGCLDTGPDGQPVGSLVFIPVPDKGRTEK
jgi:hypothetical protein